VKGTSIKNYIWLGLHWRYLQDANPGTSIHGSSVVLFNIKAVRRLLINFGLHVTERAATELTELETEFENTAENATLTVDQSNKLKETMRILQRTLSAETEGSIAYIVTDKRLDIKKLLNNTAALFSPNVFTTIPEIARHDFEEAGKCIAFERATAAAFHILRGTEGVLRWYYCSVVKKSRVSPLLWGTITSHLRKRRTPPPIELLNNLDNIRHSFRNPTQHPEKNYDIQEVQDLYGLCIDVVNRMTKEARG